MRSTAAAIAIAVTTAITTFAVPLGGGTVAAGQPASGSSAHPYSAPIWYPLRSSALQSSPRPPANPGPWSAMVSCTWGRTPGCPSPHDGPAIDFIGDEGDAVHAAGAGVFHVGAVAPGCDDSGGESSAGSWAWIDHGGGVVSRYHHLQSFAAREGQLVNPQDRIATLGHSGAPCGSTVQYLHFEILTGGIHGSRFAFGQLRACWRGAVRRYPEVHGYAGWSDVPWREVGLPPADSSCVPSVPNTPARPATTSGRPGDRAATVSWPAAPAGVTAIVVSRQLFHPSTGTFSVPTYTSIAPAGRSQRTGGLVNGRTYRFRVTWRNTTGFSTWGPAVDVIPAAAPGPPSFRRATVTARRIGYGWNRSASSGAPVIGYQLAIRRQAVDGTWTAWAYTSVGNVSWHDFQPLLPGRSYAIRVRARSAAGPSPWSVSTVLRTPRG